MNEYSKINVIRILKVLRVLIFFAIIAVAIILGLNLNEYRISRQKYDELKSLAEGSGLDTLTGDGNSSIKVVGLNEPDGYADADDAIDEALLFNINDDYIGWIRGCGGEIDYPVVMGDDNEFYLKHDFYGEKSGSGCIFAECDTVSPFDGPVTVLYGHNMRDGSMFHELLKYKDQDYLKENPSFTIRHNGEDEEFEIFSVFVRDYEDIPFIEGDEADAAYIKRLETLSLYDTGVGGITDTDMGDTAGADDAGAHETVGVSVGSAGMDDCRIVMLITCEYSSYDGRMVVCGVAK